MPLTVLPLNHTQNNIFPTARSPVPTPHKKHRSRLNHSSTISVFPSAHTCPIQNFYKYIEESGSPRTGKWKHTGLCKQVLWVNVQHADNKVNMNWLMLYLAACGRVCEITKSNKRTNILVLNQQHSSNDIDFLWELTIASDSAAKHHESDCIFKTQRFRQWYQTSFSQPWQLLTYRKS